MPILANVFGLCAVALFVLSYQMKTRRGGESAFANLTEDIIRGMCNLSDCAKSVDVTKGADGAWTIAVK